MKIFAATLLISLVSVFSMQASAEPAFVIKEFDCNGFIPDPDTGVPIFPLFTSKTHGFGVKDKIGKFTCHFDHAYPLESASAARGWICAVEGPFTGELLFTDKTVMLATPGGKALLQCQFGPTHD